MARFAKLKVTKRLEESTRMTTVTNFEPIAEGYHLEAMYPDRDCLWFSDALEPGLRRLDHDGSDTVHLNDRAMIGGILLNFDGKVLCSGIGGIVWLDPATGASGILVDRLDGAPPRRLRPMDDADGIAIDALGDIWSVGYMTSEIQRLAPDGTLREIIATPAKGITNIRFGGGDLRDLYITATSPEAIAQFQRGETPSTRESTIFRARCEVPGLAIERTNFDLAAFDPRS